MRRRARAGQQGLGPHPWCGRDDDDDDDDDDGARASTDECEVRILMGIYSRRTRCACRRAVEVTVGDGDGAHVARIARGVDYG